MAYFVVQRNADSVLSVPLQELFPTREAAVAALSSAAGAGAIAAGSEVFIADLDAAVPVLLVHVPSVEPGTLDEQAADEVYAPGPLNAFGDEASLAAALKRAASSLEDEGIVAPESVASVPTPSEEAPLAERALEELPAAEPAAPDDASEMPSLENEERAWPWANIEAYEPEVAVEVEAVEAIAADGDGAGDVAVDEPFVPSAEVEDALEVAEPEFEEPAPSAGVAELDTPYPPAGTVSEPLGVTVESEPMDASASDGSEVVAPDALSDDQPLITSAPLEGEEAYLPRPVILGDYTSSDTVLEPVVGAQVVEFPVSEDIEPDAVEPSETVVASSDGVVETDEPFDLSAALGGLIGTPTEVGYEATGDLDLAEYSCQDCIYSNTCPKVGQATPSDCGSFQWRSE